MVRRPESERIPLKRLRDSLFVIARRMYSFDAAIQVILDCFAMLAMTERRQRKGGSLSKALAQNGSVFLNGGIC